MTAAHVDDLERRRRLRDASSQASRPLMVAPDGKPDLERIGMGWEWRPHDQLTLRLTRIKERSDEFTGELTVICPGSGRVGGVIEWGRINLLSSTTRNSLAKRINAYVESSWDEWLNLFFREIVHRERQGEQLQQTDPDARPMPLRYLFRPLLPLGMPTLLYGAGGTFKSTVAAGIALSVQTGQSVFSGWDVALSGPVLILDWEGDRWIWQDRINSIATGAGIKAPPIRYRPCRRRIVDDAEAIADMVIDNGIVLVVVDAVNQAFGVSGHEMQDPADMAIKAFITIREIAGTSQPDSRTPTDVTWLLIDHTTGEDLKEGNGTPMKAYGTTAKQWLARNQFYVSTEGEGSETRQMLVIQQTKANYSWKIQPTSLGIERDDLGTIRFRLNAKLPAAALNAKLSIPQRIIAALEAGPLAEVDIRKAMDMEARRADRMKVTTTLGRMLEDKRILRVEAGKYALASTVIPLPQAEFDDQDEEPI